MFAYLCNIYKKIPEWQGLNFKSEFKKATDRVLF